MLFCLFLLTMIGEDLYVFNVLFNFGFDSFCLSFCSVAVFGAHYFEKYSLWLG